MSQVPCHRRRGTPEVRERRGEHATVADRHQVGHPGFGLLLKEVNRVRTVLGRIPPSVVGAWPRVTAAAAPPPPLVRRQNLMRRGEHPWRDLAHCVTDPPIVTVPRRHVPPGHCRPNAYIY